MRKEYQRCNRCVMTEKADVTIVFDTEGNCNYCNDALAVKDNVYFPNKIGEEKIKTFLDSTNYTYIHNKGCFNDLKGEGGGLLRPDFIIEELKLWIEYDGIQHFEPISFHKEDDSITLRNFEKGKTHDDLKNKYAKEHGYIMIRIPYWDYEKIEEILKPYFT